MGDQMMTAQLRAGKTLGLRWGNMTLGREFKALNGKNDSGS